MAEATEAKTEAKPEEVKAPGDYNSRDFARLFVRGIGSTIAFGVLFIKKLLSWCTLGNVGNLFGGMMETYKKYS